MPSEGSADAQVVGFLSKWFVIRHRHVEHIFIQNEKKMILLVTKSIKAVNNIFFYHTIFHNCLSMIVSYDRKARVLRFLFTEDFLFLMRVF